MEPSQSATGSQARPGPAVNGGISAEQFLKGLIGSGLVPADEVQAFASRLTAPQQRDARLLAQELVRQGKLTKYQAVMLYQGKSKGLLLGNYAILDKLGQGGMGLVFKARHRRMQRIVALKVLPPAVTSNPTAVQRFQREVQAVAKLDHPNIVAAYDADESHDVHFLVMEYVDGSDLSRLVKKQGPLPLGQAIDCTLQAARGLEHAHAAGIIHRDIKPSNLLLDSKGTVKILDMGLARFEDSGNAPSSTKVEELTQSGSIMGTCDYMAPEQALNTKHADQRADIYSLGCTLYYLLTGHVMFGGETSMEKLLAHRETPIPPLPGASPELEAVYRRMVAKRAEERCAAMREVIVGLEKCKAAGDPGVSLAALAARPVPAEMSETQTELNRSELTEAGLRRRPARRLSRRGWIVGGLAAAAVLGVALALVTGGGDKSASRGAGETGKTPEALAIKPGPPEGFVSLFNGKDLGGWHVGNGKPELWGVERGVLCGQPPAQWDRGWMMNDKTYSDFELRLEYRITGGSDGAIGFRAPTALNNEYRCVKVSTTDNANITSDLSKQQALTNSSLIRLVPAMRSAVRPSGEWNQLNIVARGPRITVDLNGVRTVDADLDDAGTLVGPLYPGQRHSTGHIGLQVISGRIEYRNLLIKPFPRPPDPQPPQPVVVDTPRAVLAGHEGVIYRMRFLPDGKTLVSSGSVPDTTLRLWDVDRQGLKAVLKGHTDNVYRMTVSADGTTLASCGNDCTVKLWRPALNREPDTLTTEGSAGDGVAFAPNGKILAFGLYDKTVRVWDLTARQQRQVLRHDEAVHDVQFSPDGSLLASCSGDGVIKLWDTTTWKEVAALRGHFGRVNSVAFSPDGQTLASAGWDHLIGFWDIKGRKLRTWIETPFEVEIVAIAPDGREVAAGWRGGAVGLWDLATLRQRVKFQITPMRVVALAFAPDGKTLATTHGSKIALWDIPR